MVGDKTRGDTYSFSNTADGTEEWLSLRVQFRTRLTRSNTLDRLYKQPQLDWQPLHVPLGRTLNIPNHDFKSLKVQHRNSIEADVEEDESPFEKRVGGVGCGTCEQRLDLELRGGRAAITGRSSGEDSPPATRWTLCWIKK